MEWLLIIIGWYGLGLIGAGFAVAYNNAEDSRSALWSADELARARRENLWLGLFLAMWGPACLVRSLFVTGLGKDGWTLRA